MDARPSVNVLFKSDAFELGEFRHAPGDPSRVRSSVAGSHLIAVPRTCVRIDHGIERGIIATPARAVLYNAGQEYTCRILWPRHELTTFLRIGTTTLIDALEPHDPSSAERLDAPFTVGSATTDAATFLMFGAGMVRARDAGDSLETEERLCAAVARIVGAAYGERGRPLPDPRAVQYVRWTEELLARRFAERLCLADIASRVGVSMFYLCRVFRATTGVTIRAYRDGVRLRASLDRVLDPAEDLGALAFALGYAGRSHFTQAFRRHFGTTPGRLRRDTRRSGRSAYDHERRARAR